jgi:hypothetical protein
MRSRRAHSVAVVIEFFHAVMLFENTAEALKTRKEATSISGCRKLIVSKAFAVMLTVTMLRGCRGEVISQRLC